MNNITMTVTIDANIKTVWEAWTQSKHIIGWNFASDDWCCPAAEINLSPGGSLNFRMEARDKSMGFNLTGHYDEIITHEKIASTLDDGRKVVVEFSSSDGKTTVTETFTPESENPIELQRQGWLAILNNFKKYAEELEQNKC